MCKFWAMQSPHKNLKGKTIWMPKVSFGEFRGVRGALGGQIRILHIRRPHENLIDNEIWMQRVLFSTKSGDPPGLVWRFVCKYSSTKNLDLAQKRCSSAQIPLREDIDSGVARLGDPGRPRSSLFLTRRSSG